MNLANWLYQTSQFLPDAPALLTGEKLDCSYSEFARRAGAIAAGLRTRHGIREGDRVAVYMSNTTEYLEILYGIWWAGAAAVPINSGLHPKETAWVIENSTSKVAFISNDIGSTLVSSNHKYTILSVNDRDYDALRNGESMPLVPREQDDLAWLFYTSGTTGKPKGVMLSHNNLRAMALCYFADMDNVYTEDAAFYAAPMSHAAGIYNFMHIRKGARNVMPPSKKFDAEEIMDLVPRLQNVSMFAAPTMLRRLISASIEEGYNGEGFRTITYGGGPMYQADILDALKQYGNRFVQVYGQAECVSTITGLARHWHVDREHPKYRHRLASVGTAYSAVEVKITDDDGATCTPDVPGEVEVRGLPVMLGYWDNPTATKEAFREGWLRTGDKGSIDADGFLTLSGRSKDVIISGGSNVYPREVEEVLLTHPDVLEVSVVGRPHKDWGEEVVACLTLRPGRELDSSALDTLCNDNIARFKRPKAYIKFDQLPKNNYGKVLKSELRVRIQLRSNN